MHTTLADILANTPTVALPRTLQGLPQTVQAQISDTLANDENSSDDELVQFWAAECSIPLEVAKAAVTFRDQYLRYPLFELFTPL